MRAEERKREKYLPTLLVQQIRLHWYKDCRGGNGAVRRNQYPRAMRLPKDFFSSYYLNREIKGADWDSFTVCTPLDAPPLADHLARDKEHFYQNDEIIEEPLWLERLHELKPEQ